MKLTKGDLEGGPLMRNPVKNNGKEEDPDSIRARCKRDGVTVSPSTITSRMQQYNMTYEEAIAYQPKSRREVARMNKMRSPWDTKGGF